MPGVRGVGQSPTDNYYREPMDWFAAESGPGMTTWFRPSNRNNHPHDGISVEEETDDDGSLLNHYRRLIALRAAYSTLRRGAYEKVPLSEGSPYMLAYLRQDAEAHLLVVLNLARQEASATLDLAACTLPPAPWNVTDVLSNKGLSPINETTYALKLGAQEGVVLELRRP